MLSDFVLDQTFVNVKTHQSVLSDGVNIWTTNAGNTLLMSGLHKYDMNANLLVSNVAAVSGIPDREADVYQLNGIELRNGKIYAGLMNYPNGSNWPAGDHNSGHLYAKSWIARYDAVTLAYEKKWAVGDRTVTGATSAAKWTEGCGWHEASQSWFVCFHGDPVLEQYSEDVNGDLVFIARHTLPSVDNTNQTWNAKGFEDVTFAGDYVYLNRHAATLDSYLYQYKWTGSGFTYVRKFPQSQFGAAYHQGVNIQSNTNIMWWCARTGGGAGNGSELGSISKIYARGFDLYDNHNGVYTSNDNGVKFTNSNGVIISK